MITNRYNYQIIQSTQQVQQQQQLEQQPTPEDIKLTRHCTKDFQNKLLNTNIISDRECNRLIIPYGHLKIKVAVHCPRPNQSYIPQYLFVDQKTYEEYYADIYVGYDPFTPQPQPDGFAMRSELVLMQCKPLVWVYGIQRIELDNNLDTLFNLDKLQQLSLSNISYV